MKRNKYILFTVIICFIIVCIFSFSINNKDKEVYADNEYTNKIPVLTFHRIVSDEDKKNIYRHNQWVGSAKVFESMMKYLHDNGYETISTNDFYEWYVGNREYSKKTVLITFDDGFYEDYYIVYPILKKYNIKATTFVVGSRIRSTTDKYDSKKTRFMGMDAINDIRKNYPNFEIQSHTYNMHYYTKGKKHRIKSMTYEELVEDVDLNSKFGFNTLAYPYGDNNQMIREILEQKGYLVAFRFTPSEYATRSSEKYAIPRIKINGNATLKDFKKWLKK